MSSPSSPCPSCGAGRQVDAYVNILRCPRCGYVTAPVAPRRVPAEHVGRSSVEYAGRQGVDRDRDTGAGGRIPAAGPLATLLLLAVMVAPFWAFYHFVVRSDDEPAREVAVGAPARVGSFEVTVVNVDCSKESINGRPQLADTQFRDWFVTEADGRFCVLAFSVKNVGEQTDSYEALVNVSATTATNRRLSRSFQAEHYLNRGRSLVDDQMDPGRAVTEFLVYDVPEDSSIQFLRVDDRTGGGPEVRVRIS